MKKVITYGTYDLLHQGHINLLKRAKELGDYLIVGVTADGFDRQRGKINVQQSLVERIEAVKSTGYADEIIVEEYEGQKIDDIKRYGVDIFTVGSDWIGKFDYLKEFCEVVYLDRTAGISSSELRTQQQVIRIGMIGDEFLMAKFERESHFVNGIYVNAVCCPNTIKLNDSLYQLPIKTDSYSQLLENVDAVYIVSTPQEHYKQIKQALELGKHVLCESPITTSCEEYTELIGLANKNNCVLMDAIKTAYSTAYNRLLLLVKCGAIGKVYSVDATCTSLKNISSAGKDNAVWNSLCSWGPTAMLPIIQILGGGDYISVDIYSHIDDKNTMYDSFTKVSFLYKDAVASLKVGQGVKSEGELVISGTEGYIYVPAPWWKTDYFEIRREDPSKNKRYFYQLDGEGIRYELVTFLKMIKTKQNFSYIDANETKTIVGIIEKFYKSNIIEI